MTRDEPVRLSPASAGRLAGAPAPARCYEPCTVRGCACSAASCNGGGERSAGGGASDHAERRGGRWNRCNSSGRGARASHHPDRRSSGPTALQSPQRNRRSAPGASGPAGEVDALLCSIVVPAAALRAAAQQPAWSQRDPNRSLYAFPTLPKPGDRATGFAPVCLLPAARAPGTSTVRCQAPTRCRAGQGRVGAGAWAPASSAAVSPVPFRRLRTQARAVRRRRSSSRAERSPRRVRGCGRARMRSPRIRSGSPGPCRTR